MIISRGMRLTVPAECEWKVGMIISWRYPILLEAFDTFDYGAMMPINPFCSTRQAIVEHIDNAVATIRIVLEIITVQHNSGW